MKKIVFTVHAKDRCVENGLDFRLLKNKFRLAQRTVEPLRTKWINQIWHKYKFTKYKWWGGVLYTYIVRGNAYIILTVTPKKREDVEFY